jgi:excisionase family DNA binding protein
MFGFSPRELERVMREAQGAARTLRRLQQEGYVEQVQEAVQGIDLGEIKEAAQQAQGLVGALSVEAAAKELGIGAQTVRSLVETGRLEALDVGRAIRIPIASIEEVKAAARTGAWLRGQFSRLGVDPKTVIAPSKVAPEKLERFLRGEAVPSPVEVAWIADAIADQIGGTGRQSSELRRGLAAAADYRWFGGVGGHPRYRNHEQRRRRFEQSEESGSSK